MKREITSKPGIATTAPWLAVICLLATTVAASAAPQAAPKQKLAWEQVETTVAGGFATLPNYRAGDIISRKQVEPLLNKLSAAGWKVPDAERLLARISPDSSWLVTHLRTPKGIKFMRQISGLPQGYDRVDRLTALSDGRRIVSDLIQGPGGAKMIEFLTTSRTGKNTSRELTAVPGGANFDKPTGKIYTEEDLLTALKQLYSPSARAK